MTQERQERSSAFAMHPRHEDQKYYRSMLS